MTEQREHRRFRFAPRSIGRLAIAVAVATSLVTAALAGLTYYVVHEEIERQIDHRIKIEMRALVEYEREHGFDALLQAIAIRDETGTTAANDFPDGNGADSTRTLGYMVFDANNRRRGGMLQAKRPPPGWSEFVHFARPDGTRGIAQAINAPLPDGGELVVAVDRLIVDEMDAMLFKLFVAAFGTLLIVNVGATLAFGRAIRHRLRAMNQAAGAIMAGDMGQRMPVAGADRELDELARVLNDMLDRIAALVANLRDISSGLAHDLRTPLSRLKAQLDRAERSASDPVVADRIGAANVEADALLDLFSAILAIAEVDGRDVRKRFVTVDLAVTISDIAEVHRAAFEDAGIALRVDTKPATVMGEKALLQQLTSHLLDNIIVHADLAKNASVSVGTEGDYAYLEVGDDGRGVPADQSRRIFERLVRLDPSRSRQGHGLGLSMVAAIVSAHGGTANVVPGPRFVIRVELPASPGSAAIN